jgi:hypothetical protein
MELEAQLRTEGQIILVGALLRSRIVQGRMEDTARQFPEMIDMPIMKYPPFQETPGTPDKPAEFSTEKHIPAGIDKARVEKYALALRKLADDYNLRCDWIIMDLHQQIRHMIDPSFRAFKTAMTITKPIDYFRLEVPISPETRKKDVLWRFNKEWERIKANPKFRRRRRPPEEFDLSVEWLGRRLFYGRTGEDIVRQSNDSKSYLPSDIDRAIRRAARLLDIKLPRGRPGRVKRR